VGNFLRQSAELAACNPLYARSGWGDGRGKHGESHDDSAKRMRDAQLAVMVDLFNPIAPMEIADAEIIIDHHAQNRKYPGQDGDLITPGTYARRLANRAGCKPYSPATDCIANSWAAAEREAREAKRAASAEAGRTPQ
jgi:hypothetical protein